MAAWAMKKEGREETQAKRNAKQRTKHTLVASFEYETTGGRGRDQYHTAVIISHDSWIIY